MALSSSSASNFFFFFEHLIGPWHCSLYLGYFSEQSRHKSYFWWCWWTLSCGCSKGPTASVTSRVGPELNSPFPPARAAVFGRVLGVKCVYQQHICTQDLPSILQFHAPPAFPVYHALWLLSDPAHRATPTSLLLPALSVPCILPSAVNVHFLSSPWSYLFPDAFPSPSEYNFSLLWPSPLHSFAFAAAVVFSKGATVASWMWAPHRSLVNKNYRSERRVFLLFCCFLWTRITKPHWNTQMNILWFKQMKSRVFQLGHRTVCTYSIIFVFY